MYRENEIFTYDDDEYTNRAIWCNVNGYTIEDLGLNEQGLRQFKIVKPPKPEIKEKEVTKITLRQAKLILNEKGLLANVESYINSIADEKLKATALIEWEYANEVDINNPLISAIKQGLSLSDDEVKDMFKEASRL